MVLNITSPEFSFLTFNQTTTDCSDENPLLLPVCENAKIKAQFNIDGDLDIENKLYVAICDSNCDLIYDENIEVTPVCNRYKWFSLYDETEPLPIEDPYNICNLNGDGSNLFPNPNYNTNPFSKATTTDLSFELVGSISNNKYFTLYLNDQCIVFKKGGSTTFTQLGKLWIARFPNLLSSEKIAEFLQDNIDSLVGTTTSESLGVITISNVPTETYIDDTAYSILTDITSVSTGVAGIYAKNIYYNFDTKQINYYAFDTVDLEATLKTDVVMANSSNYIIKYGYATINDFNHTFKIFNSSNVEVFSNNINPLPTSFTGENVVLYFIAPIDDTFTFVFSFIPENQTDQIAFDNVYVIDSPLINVTSSVSTTGYTPIPNGTYNKEELYALLKEILEIDFDCEFINCCKEFTRIEFTHVADEVTIIYKFSHLWNVGYIDFPEVDVYDISSDCFSYCILNEAKEQIACSNLFKKQTDCCYVSAIEYSSNENSMSFFYPTGVTNYIQLPFYVHSPEYPKKETIYKRTNGTYARLATDIEKEYACESEYLNEEMHNKLVTALNHDTLILTSNRLGFTAQVTQQGDYTPQWNNKIDFTAMAEFKLRKYFNGKNNNCGTNCE